MNSDWVIRNVMYNSLHYTTECLPCLWLSDNQLRTQLHWVAFQQATWMQMNTKWLQESWKKEDEHPSLLPTIRIFKKLIFSKKQIAYYTVCSKHIGKTYLLCYYSNSSSSNVAVPAKQRQIMISQVVSHGRCHRRRLIRLIDNILTITFSVPFPRPIYRTAYKPLIKLFEIQYMYPEFRLH